MKRSKKCNAVILAVLLAKTRGYGGRRGRSSVPFLSPDLGGQYFLALSFWLSFSSPPLSIWRPSSRTFPLLLPSLLLFAQSGRNKTSSLFTAAFSLTAVSVSAATGGQASLLPKAALDRGRKKERAKGWRVRSRGYETKTMTIIKLGYILATGLSHQGLTF